MSEQPTAAEHAQTSLSEASYEIRSAYRLIDDLHAGLSGASNVLVDVELETKRAGYVEDGPRAQVHLVAAAEEMGRLHHRCQETMQIGVEISGHLNNAATAVDEAKVAVGQISRDGLSTQEACDVAALAVRVDNLQQVIELSRPLATAATGHVDAAADVAARNSRVSLDERSRGPEIARVSHGVNVATNELGRAEEVDRHLDTAVGQATTTAHRTAGHADYVSEAARRRMDQQRDPTPSAGTPSMFGPSR